MIRIAPKPEYPEFDQSVRQPGRTFLRTTPHPTTKEFKKKNYWSRALRELNAAYSGICAYTAMYMAADRGSVDHFRPKATHPHLAYEWSNYRLAGGRINSTKGNSLDVLDPMEIEDDWFHLDLPSCLIRANPRLDRGIKSQVNSTINTLRLNADDIYVDERCNILMEYAKGQIGYDFLRRRYPFLAKEITRQNLDGQLVAIFRI